MKKYGRPVMPTVEQAQAELNEAINLTEKIRVFRIKDDVNDLIKAAAGAVTQGRPLVAVNKLRQAKGVLEFGFRNFIRYSPEHFNGKIVQLEAGFKSEGGLAKDIRERVLNTLADHSYCVIKLVPGLPTMVESYLGVEKTLATAETEQKERLANKARKAQVAAEKVATAKRLTEELEREEKRKAVETERLAEEELRESQRALARRQREERANSILSLIRKPAASAA